jgi:hypothetical protein
MAVCFGRAYFAFRADASAGMVTLVRSRQPIIVALVVPGWNGD